MVNYLSWLFGITMICTRVQLRISFEPDCPSAHGLRNVHVRRCRYSWCLYVLSPRIILYPLYILMRYPIHSVIIMTDVNRPLHEQRKNITLALRPRCRSGLISRQIIMRTIIVLCPRDLFITNMGHNCYTEWSLYLCFQRRLKLMAGKYRFPHCTCGPLFRNRRSDYFPFMLSINLILCQT